MTALGAVKGVFTTRSDLEFQRIDGFGFSPAAVVAWWSRQDGHGARAGNRGGAGFWTAEQDAAAAWTSEDGVTSARAAQVAESAAILGLADASAHGAMRAEVASFDDDGVTLRWTTSPSETWVVHYLALGGAALKARIGWTSSSADTGSPDLALFVQAGGSAIGIGATDPRTAAFAGYSVQPGGRPGSVEGVQRIGTAPLSLDEQRGPASYLGLDGVRATVGVACSPPRPGTVATRVGFRPVALLFFSWGLATSAAPRGIGRLCLGAAAAGEAGCVSWDDRNVDAPETATHVRSSGAHVLVVTDTRTEGIHAQAELVSFDEGGFTLDWTASDGTAREFVYVAVTVPPV